ncbi:MAG TPA: hypothetical protein VGD83_36695, partial [Streptosporangiaceae bacterium]
GPVAAFSVGVVPRQISGASGSARARHYLAAGTLEPGFRRSARGAGGAAAKGRGSCAVTTEWTGGHDQVRRQQ